MAKRRRARMSEQPAMNARAGLLYGLAAHGLWGLMPLYFDALGKINSFELLAHRIVWCFVVLVAIVTATCGWPALRICLRNRMTLWLLVASGVLIGLNWYLFLYGVETKQIDADQSRLLHQSAVQRRPRIGDFPRTVAVVQWLAVAIAAAGIAYLIVITGELRGWRCRRHLVRACTGWCENHAGRRRSGVDGRDGGMAAVRAGLPPFLERDRRRLFSGELAEVRRPAAGKRSGDSGAVAVFRSGGAAAVDDDARLLTISRAERAIPDCVLPA